jgi:hypothetical protein
MPEVRSMTAAKIKPKKLVVVLGMHRSGTSALTRALPAFGVDLGDRLMPAVAGDNDKGFWEDLDLYGLNGEALAVLGLKWDSEGEPAAAMFDREEFASLRSRCLAILKSRLAGHETYGLKDPRICRLLPFWQPILRELDVEAAYLLAIRNPKSVAQSLRARNGIEAAKAYRLWMQHMMGAISGTVGQPRLCVDYDELLLDPQRQLRRIGEFLGRPADAEAASEYTAEFLEQNLRRSRFFIGDLEDDADASEAIRKLYELLRCAALEGSVRAWAAVDGYVRLQGAVTGMR